jgi:hypothetical protein
MAHFKDAYTEHQLKRWMRPDAHHFVRPDWRRLLRPGYESDFPLKIYERKYSLDQPRVPAGSSDGGQWTSGGSGADAKPSPSGSRDEPHISRRVAEDCELLKRLDRFTCQSVRTRSCWAQANFRYSQCLIGGYIPPIYH